MERKKHQTLQFLERNAPVPGKLLLKKGTQVMLMVDLNQQHGLVRGSRGVVVGVTEEKPQYPIVKFARCTSVIRSYMFKTPVTSETFVWFAQVPLRWGWSFPIRFMDGQSIDRVSLDMRHIYHYGMAYSILAKVRSLEDLKLTHIDWRCVKAHPKVQKYYSALIKSSKVGGNAPVPIDEGDGDVDMAINLDEPVFKAPLNVANPVEPVGRVQPLAPVQPQ
jgi:hypothetical protein